MNKKKWKKILTKEVPKVADDISIGVSYLNSFLSKNEIQASPEQITSESR